MLATLSMEFIINNKIIVLNKRKNVNNQKNNCKLGDNFLETMTFLTRIIIILFIIILVIFLIFNFSFYRLSIIFNKSSIFIMYVSLK